MEGIYPECGIIHVHCEQEMFTGVQYLRNPAHHEVEQRQREDRALGSSGDIGERARLFGTGANLESAIL